MYEKMQQHTILSEEEALDNEFQTQVYWLRSTMKQCIGMPWWDEISEVELVASCIPLVAQEPILASTRMPFLKLHEMYAHMLVKKHMNMRTYVHTKLGYTICFS